MLEVAEACSHPQRLDLGLHAAVVLLDVAGSKHELFLCDKIVLQHLARMLEQRLEVGGFKGLRRG